jgi:tetratricopeptide (TPR) repeat protein
MPLRRTLAALLFLAGPLCADPAEDKMLERYKQVLTTNPTEGIAFDRLWKAYLDQGRTNQLIEEYRAPGTYASEMVLGHLLRRAGQNDQATAAYERAAKLDPKNSLPLLALAKLAAGTGKPRESAGWYEKAVPLLPRSDPKLAEVLMQLGAQWLALGDATKAAEAWELTVAAKPGDLELRRRLAETYAQNHLPDRAIRHLEYLEEHSPPAERALSLQQAARIHQGAGNQDGAIAALDKALALTTPGNWLRGELQSQLIRLHQRYHRTAELEERWKKYAADNPRDLTGYLQLIDLYERLGDLEHERLWLERLTQIVPKNPDYRLRLARLLVQMDQPDPAAAIYDALLLEQPANADFVFERARIDVQREATPAARDRIAKLLELRKKDESIRAKALEFYELHRLNDLIEEHLTADVAAGSKEALLALANFYFAQRRDPDATRTLERLVNPKQSPEQQAAARFKIAQVLKGQNSLGPAVAELEKAVQLQPQTRDFQMLLGDLQLARGQPVEAQAAFQKAVALSKPGAEEAEADQKLFESFRNQQAELGGELRSPGIFLLPTPSGEPPRASNPALDQFLAAMEQAASEKPSEQAWLRVARWRAWNREARAASQAVGKALAANPKSVPAYELMVKLSILDGPTPAGVFHLMKLIEIDPANRLNYQRRAGQLDLQAGRVTEALATFTQLAQDSPGNVDALTDLALTQQRADRWSEALETWRQIYALSPASKKKEAFGPLLRVLERLGMHPQSAELQLKAIEAEVNEREQFQLFGELLTHCSKHGLLDWLRTQFEQRRKLRADDYFTEMALGRILKVTGNKAAAFEVLADASYAAPNQAEALPELIREAEELRKLDAAVKLQAQLLRIVPQSHSEGFEKLAQLQEKNFDLAEAARTWDRIVAKYPRDTGVLSHAVDFQLRWGTPERAAELLRKVRTLEAGNLKALAALADLDIESGNLVEAEACLDQILKSSPAEAPGDAIRYPALKPEDAGRLQSAYLTTVRQRKGRASSEAMRALRSFWVEEASESKGERDLRLNAIRQLGQLVRDRDDAGASLRAWTERWRKSEAPSEALWALYYAGAGEAMLDRLEAMMQGAPRDAKMPQAYIWLALQTGQFTRLSAWLQDRRRTASERDYLQIALGQYLAVNEGRIDPELTEKLFPKGFGLRLWQTAQAFATRNRFREAALLGQRVFNGVTTQRATFGRELARWHLLLGQTDQAREVLRAAIGTPAESFDADIYGALREYYLLLPESERPEFVEAYLAEIHPDRQPLHLAIAGTLLRGLSGDARAAREHLDALLKLRALASLPSDEPGTAGSRRWRLLLTAGAQLQAWRLDHLAIYLWDKALTDDALTHLQGEQAQDTARDIRQRLYALRTAHSTGFEAQQWIDAFARVSPRDGLIPLGEALESFGAYSQAIEVYRQLWERDPANPQALRNLLSACRAGNDNDSAEAVLWICAGRGAARANDSTNRDLGLQLVDLLERKGELERARVVLSDAVESAPADTRLLLRLAQLHERSAHPDLAEAVYRRLLTIEPGNSAARIALAALLEGQGRAEVALTLLLKGGGPEVDARLAQLQIKAGQPEDALATLERIPAPQHVTPSLSIATALAERGNQRLARGVIQAALARTVDPGMSFPLLCKAVELLQPVDGKLAARLELRRLRQVANEQPSLLGSYLDFAQTQAGRLGLGEEFATELSTLWAEGSGPIAAGAVLLAAELKNGDRKAGEETFNQLMARDDAGEVWLYRLAGVLESAPAPDGAAPVAAEPEWVARVREKLARTNPASEQLALDWARALEQLGRKDEARAVLEKLAVRIAIFDEFAGKVAQAFADLGDRDRAARLFVQAMRNDPYVRNYQAWLDYARLQLARQDLAGAKRTLRTAYSNPANRDFGVLIEWLAAAGRLDQAESEVAEFGLSPARRIAVRRALFARFAEERKLAAATALVKTHPETLTPAIAATLRELAKADTAFEEVAAIFEEMAQQPSGSELTLELARLYADWAATEVAVSKTDSALDHLGRAHKHRPEVFEIARDLATLQSQTGAKKAAIDTLVSYLSAGKNPADLEKAEELLARLKTGGKL